MTAESYPFGHDFLAGVATRIMGSRRVTVFQSRWRDWTPETPKSRTDKTDKGASVSNVSASPGHFPENKDGADRPTEHEGSANLASKTPPALTDKTDKSLAQGFPLTADITDKTSLVTLLRVPSGCPETWVEEGIQRLLSMPAPRGYSAEEWAILKDDAAGFFWRWSGEAALLGWDTLAVWSVHPTKPRGRLDCMGLVPALRGRRVFAMTAEAAAIGGLHFYRPQIMSEAMPLWELP